jgi:hypothetical protein
MQGPPSLATRVGNFFILIGVGFLCMFLLTLLGRQFHFIYFLVAVISLLVGFRLRGKPNPPPPSGRFGIVNKSREQIRRNRDLRAKKQQEKEARKKKK